MTKNISVNGGCPSARIYCMNNLGPPPRTLISAPLNYCSSPPTIDLSTLYASVGICSLILAPLFPLFFGLPFP